MKVTHVAVVLDESGSMEKTKVETISGINEQFETLKALVTPDHEIRMTLVVFGSTVRVQYIDRPLNEIEMVSEETYTPKGWTALYDAVGQTIVHLEDDTAASEDDAFWLMVVSDGQENHSKEYKAHTLAAVINRLQASGKWTISYLGTGHDLGVVNRTLGVSASNMCNYTSGKIGTTKGHAVNRLAATKYMKARSEEKTSCLNLYSDEDQIATADSIDTSSVEK
jgi:uncharacterized protein YegL